MSEFQKIAIGVLSMSHPEIYRSGILSAQSAAQQPATAQAAAAALQPAHKPASSPTAPALRVLKFALAALLAGSRSIPLGDNGRVTRELGEYGSHLRGC
jgi:hypothetical protein